MINHDNKQDEFETDHTSVACHQYSLIHTNQSTKIFIKFINPPPAWMVLSTLKEGVGSFMI